MPTKSPSIYQFKITLKNINPQIWRDIQVPKNYNFWDLHVAIQDAMGWEDYHLHQFNMEDPITGNDVRVGIPDEDCFDGYEIIPGSKAKISRYFLAPRDKAIYEYDFGDGWEHEIVLEKILLADEGVKYPKCIAGERACPPEDCGGSWGYEELLDIIKDPKHYEYEEIMEWLADDFDPENFTPEDVEFDDPKKRYKIAFG